MVNGSAATRVSAKSLLATLTLNTQLVSIWPLKLPTVSFENVDDHEGEQFATTLGE